MSVFIPIPKKGNDKECSNYRMIALISHAMGIVTWKNLLVSYEVKHLPDDFAISYLGIFPIEIKSVCLYKFLNTNSIYIFICYKQLTLKWRKEKLVYINERNKLMTLKALMNHKCIILRERS